MRVVLLVALVAVTVGACTKGSESSAPLETLSPGFNANSYYGTEFWNKARVVTVGTDEICVQASDLPRMCDEPAKFAGTPGVRVGDCVEFVDSHPYGVARTRPSNGCDAAGLGAPDTTTTPSSSTTVAPTRL